MTKKYPSIVVTECVYCPLLKMKNGQGYCTHYRKTRTKSKMKVDVTTIPSFCNLFYGGVIRQDYKPTIKSKFSYPYFDKE